MTAVHDPTTSTSTAYIDYDAITSASFSPTRYANSLVLSTNNATDTPLDLSTPLSRVLFDVQEIDTHIDTLTTTHALPLLEYTRQRNEAGREVLEKVEESVRGLNERYARLEREVGERYRAAEQVRLAAERMAATLRLGRAVQRVVTLGRQLEGHMADLSSGAKGGHHRAMVAAAGTVLALRQIHTASGPGEEGEGLEKVKMVGSLRQEVTVPAERTLLARAQQVVREFSMSSLLAGGREAGGQQTFAQTEETKERTTCALQTLYLLSPVKGGARATAETFEPTLLLAALQSYLQTALTSSIAALARALATLPTLDRTLLEISARCQNIVALEALLESIRPPFHPLLAIAAPTVDSSALPSPAPPQNFLTPLLKHLDTSSLPSFFWRSMAGQLSPRVQEILNRGGVSARTLRTNRERVGASIRECVNRGSLAPVSGLGGKAAGAKGGERTWEREAAVMVGSVVGPLQRS